MLFYYHAKHEGEFQIVKSRLYFIQVYMLVRKMIYISQILTKTYLEKIFCSIYIFISYLSLYINSKDIHCRLLSQSYLQFYERNIIKIKQPNASPQQFKGNVNIIKSTLWGVNILRIIMGNLYT